MLDITTASIHDACMRTTIQLDHDIESQLRILVKKQGKSLRQIVNEYLRIALSGGASGGEAEERFKVAASPLGLRTGIDPLRFNQLLDQQDAEDFSSECL